ncbi:putative membrane protein YesL [Bacillus ectoiniformans]|uniref:YesL family protein n=1 Tax=Bacillus ectoiniformans TaxID=1494429 RepID=UPI00195D0AA5|nr:DUF624 domain-containing protein [Bacillus ectoiniformans]MBM7649502.1 putative membrane protein YesL [Bacillus ectoiniformans]
MRNLVDGLYSTSEWIMRFSLVNGLWVLLTLPFSFFVFQSVKAESAELMFLFAVPAALLAPVLFFPATAAMFASVRDWILEREHDSIIRSYLAYYKGNYKKSVQGGIIFTSVWSILIADYMYFQSANTILSMAFLIFGLLLYVLTVNFFSVNAHYDMKVGSLVKKAALLTAGSPVLLIAVLLTGMAFVYVSVRGPLFLLLFFTGSLTAFLSFSAFYRLYLTLTRTKEERL